MNPEILPSFETIERALICLKALGTAAETHGLLCAFMSYNVQIRKQAWVNSLLSNMIKLDDVMAKDAATNIERLFEVTQQQFQSFFSNPFFESVFNQFT